MPETSSAMLLKSLRGEAVASMAPGRRVVRPAVIDLLVRISLSTVISPRHGLEQHSAQHGIGDRQPNRDALARHQARTLAPGPHRGRVERHDAMRRPRLWWRGG